MPNACGGPAWPSPRRRAARSSPRKARTDARRARGRTRTRRGDRAGRRHGRGIDAPCGDCPASGPGRRGRQASRPDGRRSEEHTSELQVTNAHLVCRLLLEKKKTCMKYKHSTNNYNHTAKHTDYKTIKYLTTTHIH